MKGLVLYFSGTGNTKVVANQYVKIFEKKGFEMKMYSFEEEFHINSSGLDCLIIGFPKYYELAPMQVLTWIEQKIPVFLNKTDVLLFCTQCGPTKIPDYLVRKCLKEKNVIVKSSVFYQMANNYFLVRVFVPTDEFDIKIRNQNMKAKVEEVVLSYLDKKMKEEPLGRNIELACLLFLKGYEKVIPRQIKQIRVNEWCCRCGKCVRNCPMKNIEMTGDGPKLGLKCMMCVRCLNTCPSNAFEYKGERLPRYEKLMMQYDGNKRK